MKNLMYILLILNKQKYIFNVVLFEIDTRENPLSSHFISAPSFTRGYFGTALWNNIAAYY